MSRLKDIAGFRRRTLFSRLLAVGASVLLTGSLNGECVLLAQCVMCKVAASSGGAAAGRALNFAILVLLVPPVAIFCTIFAVAFKRRRKGGDD